MIKKKFISVAKDVINLEIKALQILRQSINSSFNEAVIQISKCQSKVVLCGVGKSGLIASKIAATLASVGHHHLVFLQMKQVMEILVCYQKKIS